MKQTTDYSKYGSGIQITALLLFLVSCCLFVTPSVAEDLQPLPVVNSANIRLVEGTGFCFASYGTQSNIFAIGSEQFSSAAVSDPLLPSFQPHKTTFIKMGCFTNQIYLSYSLIDDSAKLEKEVIVDSNPYNSIQFETHALSVGYSFSLIPHQLYLDLGVSYSRTDYILGLYQSDLGANAESERTSADAFSLSTSINFYVTQFLFLNWQHQRSIDDTYVILYSNQLGLNFLARF